MLIYFPISQYADTLMVFQTKLPKLGKPNYLKPKLRRGWVLPKSDIPPNITNNPDDIRTTNCWKISLAPAVASPLFGRSWIEERTWVWFNSMYSNKIIILTITTVIIISSRTIERRGRRVDQSIIYWIGITKVMRKKKYMERWMLYSKSNTENLIEQVFSRLHTRIFKESWTLDLILPCAISIYILHIHTCSSNYWF